MRAKNEIAVKLSEEYFVPQSVMAEIVANEARNPRRKNAIIAENRFQLGTISRQWHPG